MKSFTQIFSRWVATLLLAVLSVSAYSRPIYVSAKAGNDALDGRTWNTAVKTLSRAFTLLVQQSDLANTFYMAEGDYDAPRTLPSPSYPGTYVTTRDGEKLTFVGGFPTPNAGTLPEDTCSQAPKRYVTRINPTSPLTNSMIRLNGNNQSLVFRGLRFADSPNFVASDANGTLVTFDYNNRVNPYFEMTDCVVEGYKTGSGGYIYFYGGITNPVIKVEHVEVYNGKSNAPLKGGGFLGQSPGGGSTNLQVDINNVSFHDVTHAGTDPSNAIFGFRTGGTKAQNPNSYVNIDRVQVYRNTGARDGNHVSSIQIEGVRKVTITNSIFQDAVAGSGGAVKAAGFVTFTARDNQYIRCMGDNGGALTLTPGYLNAVDAGEVRNAYFINEEYDSNTANAAGGAVYVVNTTADKKLNVIVDNCNFINNKSTSRGNAFLATVLGDVTVTNSRFCNNTPLGGGVAAGGAMVSDGSGKTNVNGCYFSGNASGAGGCGALLTHSTLGFDIRNTVFINNTGNEPNDNTHNPGGAIGGATGKAFGNIVNCKFYNNRAGSFGGAIGYRNVGDLGKNINIDQCLFEGNQAPRGGAIGFQAAACGMIVTNSEFRNNQATISNGGVLFLGGTNAGTYTISNSKITGNTAVANGGVVSSTGPNDGLVTLNNNVITGNKAATGGVVSTGSAPVNMTKNYIANNSATINGGVLYNSNAQNTINLTNNRYSANTAVSGGAIYTEDIASLVSAGEMFNDNAATEAGGAIRIRSAQAASIKIQNGTFVHNTSTMQNGGGALWIQGFGGALLGTARFVVDELNNCTFYNNQAYTAANVLSATAPAADISTDNGIYSFTNLINSRVQLAKAAYNATYLVDGGGNTYAYNTAVVVPATDGTDYLSNAGAIGIVTDKFVATDCQPVTPTDHTDITIPHGRVTTNNATPNNYAVYCPGDANWVKFQSISGEGPFKFYYDVFKTVGKTITKLASLVAATDPTPIITTNGVYTDTTYVDSVVVTNALELAGVTTTKAGELYTFVITQIEDYAGNVYSYDCIGSYDVTRHFSQNVGAQIFFRDCTVQAGDLDYDNDGILNTVECLDISADNLAQKTQSLTKNANWPVPYVTQPYTSSLFAKMVKDPNYLTAPTTGRVLSLSPALLGAGTSGDIVDKDVSTSLGLPEGSIIVSVYNYAVSGGNFVTGKANTYTRWEIKGRAQAFALMQSTPLQQFTAGSQFDITILGNLTPLSQTYAYTPAAPGSYTIYETGTYSKQFVNLDGLSDVNEVALSYLNYNPGNKYFEFTQSDKIFDAGVRTSVTLYVPCDNDMDGVPNMYDFDSDGDGCLDAIEGDKLVNANVVVDGMIEGGKKVDANGVPTYVAGGQAIGASQDPAITAGCSYWIGGVSTDYNNVENWGGKYVPVTGEDLVFATVDNNGAYETGNTQAGPAVRDMLLPANAILTQGALVNSLTADYRSPVTGKMPALVIPAGAGLSVTSAAGYETLADTAKLVLKASPDNSLAPATFLMNNPDACSQVVNATVEFKPLGKYTPGVTTVDTDPTSPEFGGTLYSEFEWQYFGVPVESVIKNPTFGGMKVRAYDETLNDPMHYYRKWADVQRTDAMTAFRGYEIVPVTDAAVGKTVAIAGKLNFCQAELPLTRRAAIVPISKATTEDGKRYGLGYNIFGNSYTAGINIASLAFNANDPAASLDKTVYLYATGSFKDWGDNTANTTTMVKGGYVAVPLLNAGLDGFPATIAPMQGFMVRYLDPTYSATDGVLTIPYGNSTMSNNTIPLRAKSMTMSEETNGVVIVTLDNGKVYDVAHLYENTYATPKYDNGRDAEKLNLGTPSVYATSAEGTKLQVSSLPTIDRMTFSVQTEQGASYTMKLEERRLNYADLKLVDLIDRTVTPFVNGKATYAFTSDVTGFEDNRFLLVNTLETDFATIMGSVTDIAAPSITLEAGRATIYTLSGKRVGEFDLPLDKAKLRRQLPAGVYIMKSTDGTVTESRKFVIE